MSKLTEKCKKEIEKFCEWAKKKNYIIKGEVWSLELLEDFEEPSRNKLEMYIKGLLETQKQMIFFLFNL